MADPGPALGTPCPSCGQTTTGDRFCTHCGASLASSRPTPAPPRTGPQVCLGCGRPLAPEVSFCTECGRPVERGLEDTLLGPPTPVAPAPAPPVSTVARTTPRRRIAPWVAALVAMAVLAVAAFIGVPRVMDLFRRDSEAPAATDTSAPATPGRSDSPSVGASPSGSPDSPSAHPTPAPSTAVPSQVRCWDGSTSDQLADCSLPTGVRGLRWVFPSFARARGCADQSWQLSSSGIKTAMWECPVTGPSGAAAVLRFSEFRSVREARFHYAAKGQGGGRVTEVLGSDGRVERLVWRYPPAGGPASTMSSVYARYPYSMSIDAGSDEDREWLFTHRVSFRPAATIRGTS